MNILDFFERKTRSDDREYVTTSLDCPSYITDFIRSVHKRFCSLLPNDWIYEVIYEAISDLQDSDNDLESVRFEPDCYNKALIDWLYNDFSLDMIEESKEEIGKPETFIAQLSFGQYYAKKIIYELVNNFISEIEVEK